MVLSSCFSISENNFGSKCRDFIEALGSFMISMVIFESVESTIGLLMGIWRWLKRCVAQRIVWRHWWAANVSAIGGESA